MNGLDIKDILDYYKNKVKLIIIIALFICLLGCVYVAFFEVTKYESSTSILLVSDTKDSQLTYNDLYLNQNLVGTYSEIVKSKRVLKQVIKKLDLKYTYKELSKMIDVSGVDDTELIEISVLNEDSLLAKKIANETASVFSKEVLKLYNISNVNILDKAEISNTPAGLSVYLKILIIAFIGIVFGCIIVFIVYYFDVTIKSKEQVETKIGLPVIGTVREFK